MKLRSWIAAIFCAAALAQNGQVSEPFLGFVHDASQIRLVRGIAPAAVISAPVPGEEFKALATGEGFAVALKGPARTATCVDGTGKTRVVTGATDGAERVLTAEGTTALLLHRSGSAELISCSPPALTGRLRLASDQPSVIAMGRRVLAYAGGPVNGFYLQSMDRGIQFIPMEAPVTALTFSGARVFAASGRSVYAFENGRETARFDAGEPGATDLAWVPQREALVAAWRDTGTIVAVTRDGRMQRIDCGCSIAALEKLTSATAWRITSANASGFRLLDWSGQKLLLLFAARAEEARN